MHSCKGTHRDFASSRFITKADDPHPGSPRKGGNIWAVASSSAVIPGLTRDPFSRSSQRRGASAAWIPACAGMTENMHRVPSFCARRRYAPLLHRTVTPPSAVIPAEVRIHDHGRSQAWQGRCAWAPAFAGTPIVPGIRPPRATSRFMSTRRKPAGSCRLAGPRTTRASSCHHSIHFRLRHSRESGNPCSRSAPQPASSWMDPRLRGDDGGG